ncbi:MAG: molybdopterin-dependent oxidoreductase [Spirochaetales bacterium]|uniref:Molybdopterin-dependent oxidoreductase n=1 Tax=Candidatus Thalassospirochaeta sargassi TaxID=3119039 RepID=A0AAJ1IFD2_9SPIO|nr:molybdopterin-dependent oxidoreductase [Spirochaetales bacterium]
MSEKFTNAGHSHSKIDSIALACGNEKYTDDFMTDTPLHIAFLYSDIANGIISSIDYKAAEQADGVKLILYHGNTPDTLHTTAGQGYPEPSPYDCRMFDKKVRFVGDRIAAVVADTYKQAEAALKLIKVEIEQLPALFDIEKAIDAGSPVIHSDDEYPAIPVTYKPEENIAAEIVTGFGDLEKGFKQADLIIDETYSMQYASHCATEPHAVSVHFDERGRLVIITATQVPYHVRRIVSIVCGIEIKNIRVIKPRVGGGFGGKQEVFLEQVAALAAWRLKRSIKIVLSRKEVFISARTRHAMRSRIKMGVQKDGTITALDVDDLMNAGAYAPHALTVLSNAGAKVLPLFNKIENLRFSGRSVYTNLPVGGAYRGYGATQGYFALNQHIDEAARYCGEDFCEYVKKRHIKSGETSRVFEALGEGKEGVRQFIKSCGLTECIDRGAKAIEWEKLRGKKLRNGNRIRGVGAAVAMQGSGIPEIDMASCHIKMNEDGSFNLNTGATDIGTGSDTILAQIAAEALKTDYSKMIVLSSDTDTTPFDTGAYASSTTYITGNAVKQCALKVYDLILKAASEMLGADKNELKVEDSKVSSRDGRTVEYGEICAFRLYTSGQLQIQASSSFVAHESPPPFTAQFADLEVDIETGEIILNRIAAAVDCGHPLNPLLAEGQVEGAVLNGISYALTEDYIFNSNGRMTNPDLGRYKIFNTVDTPEIITILADTYEDTGPYGAKSVGEIALNGPAPAIANAVYDAVGIRLRHTPFTPEKVWKLLNEQ